MKLSIKDLVPGIDYVNLRIEAVSDKCDEFRKQVSDHRIDEIKPSVKCLLTEFEELHRQMLTLKKIFLQQNGHGRRACEKNKGVQNCIRNCETSVGKILQEERTLTRKMNDILGIPEKKWSEEETCAICYDAPVAVVTKPCGHMILCAMCACRTATCSMCRTPIVERLRKDKLDEGTAIFKC
ncbi:E3 ubiquitin-protein ligase XIAP-like [Anneissia japonica]|uniref:E3 ubiquitin-protein ligase XIAP-like n=1 Tax=Anneissia japonica TaxID=1529436 RepID=UPI001425B24F|nr:E3 ubiquitin-protein ligase XIAP-like [Anneissia japonica]